MNLFDRLAEALDGPFLEVVLSTLRVRAQVEATKAAAQYCQSLYLEADRLDSEGFRTLAKEVRAQADAISIAEEGTKAALALPAPAPSEPPSSESQSPDKPGLAALLNQRPSETDSESRESEKDKPGASSSKRSSGRRKGPSSQKN